MNCLKIAESNPLYSPTTPFSLTISLATVIGLVTAAPLPAAYLLAWITTLVVSIGWIIHEAILPDKEPIKNGLAYWLKKESLLFIFVDTYKENLEIILKCNQIMCHFLSKIFTRL